MIKASTDLASHCQPGLPAGPGQPPWLITWDTHGAAGPELWRAPASPAKSASLFARSSGSFFLFAGHPLHGDGPLLHAAAIAEAYDSSGLDLFAQLRGSFALAGWDAPRRRLFAGRDAFGVASLYYFWSDGLCVLSPFLDTLFHHPRVPYQFDAPLILEHLLGRCPQAQLDESFFRGIQRLPPAHVLCLCQGRLVIQRYWDPLPPGVQWATAAERRRLVPVLEQAVTRALRAGADSIALSSGYDSVALAALAEARDRTTRPLRAISIRFTRTPLDEGPLQALVARALGLPQLITTVEESLGGQSMVSAVLSHSRLSPSPVSNLFQGLAIVLLRSATAQGHRRIMSGLGGDELFNVDPIYGADCLAALAWRDLWQLYRAWHQAFPQRQKELAWGILYRNSLKPIIADLFKESLGSPLVDRISPEVARARLVARLPQWLTRSGRSRAAGLIERQQWAHAASSAISSSRYLRALRSLPLSAPLMTELDQSFAWCQRYGVSFLYPFYDPDVVELVLRIHPRHLMADGWAKAPLRRLVAQRVPELPRHAHKVDFSTIFHALFRAEAQRHWEQLGGVQMLDHLGLVDPRQADQRIHAYLTHPRDRDLSGWLLITAEAWLQHRCCRPNPRLELATPSHATIYLKA